MRKNAFLVDINGVIKHSVIKLNMVHDCIKATYFSKQSIDNGCFCTCSVFVSNDGEDRLFIATESGRSFSLSQLKEPKTYDELDAVRLIIKDFNS